MTTTSKIRIKLGPIEVEYEGSEDFLKKELPELLAAVSKLHQESSATVPPVADASAEAQPSPKHGQVKGTTGTIAAKLGGNSGAELLTAAAAQLTLVEGKAEFSKKELSQAAKQATNYWKKSYQNNFANYLGTLVANHSLIEVRTGVYALDAKKRESLEAALASR